MTILEAIGRVNESKPNSILNTMKVKWLSIIEWKIMRELVETHEDSDKISYSGYNEKTPLDTVLLAPAPYDEMYVHWLEAQIDLTNGEIGKYNNSMSLYNAEADAFYRYYKRTHKPLQKHSIKCF